MWIGLNRFYAAACLYYKKTVEFASYYSVVICGSFFLYLMAFWAFHSSPWSLVFPIISLTLLDTKPAVTATAIFFILLSIIL